MKNTLFSLLLLSGILPVFGQATGDNRRYVADFIACVKLRNPEKLAALIEYPLNREAPLPSINDKQAFVARYHEVFDEKLIQMIIASSPDRDWSTVGWRGTMLNDGDLWINEDGKVYGINYHSAAELARKEALIREAKQQLYPSLAQFKRPVKVLETTKFRIRIDELADGTYRYASWSLPTPMSEKPDLVLTKGAYEAEGSGGNHSFVFKNGEYTYTCSINVIGPEDMAPATLTVVKAGKVLLEQNAKIITN